MMKNQKDLELTIPLGKLDEFGFIPPPPPVAQANKPKSSGTSEKGYTPAPPPPKIPQPSKPTATSTQKPKTK
ncbi:MAG: hypothetical protein IPM53_17400 [Anaerolineaceae bacterium]|nr:hypothetical protein [Anaerolineaceae bacterium]